MDFSALVALRTG